MITHHIEKYKPKVCLPPTPQERMSKLAYNVWLSANVHVKIGDIIINRFILDRPVKAPSIFIVDDIQEIHYMVEYEGNTPKCLHIRNNCGVSFWTIPGYWVKCPEEVMKQAGVDAATFDWRNLC